MLDDQRRRFISNLPVDTIGARVLPQTVDAVSSIDIEALPPGVVVGSNLLQFTDGAGPELRSSVALSLLAAQRVASNDPTLLTPRQWIDRHNFILSNLNWVISESGEVEAEFKDFEVAVHEAIIPFLLAAFGGTAVGAGLILKALEQLKETDKRSSWITLFNRESRRFDVSEYQFSVVEVVGDETHMKLASARLGASFGKTQVLFFRVKREEAKFESAHQKLTANSAFLAEMNFDLKAKLAGHTKTFIQGLPL